VKRRRKRKRNKSSQLEKTKIETPLTDFLQEMVLEVPDFCTVLSEPDMSKASSCAVSASLTEGDQDG
jgi:hypothetical protein